MTASTAKTTTKDLKISTIIHFSNMIIKFVPRLNTVMVDLVFDHRSSLMITIIFHGSHHRLLFPNARDSNCHVRGNRLSSGAESFVESQFVRLMNLCTRNALLR